MVRLVHLQRHDLLLGGVVADVVGGGLALRAGLAVTGVLPPLVLPVVEGGEGQHVEEEERRSDGDGDTELGGIIPWILHHQGARHVFVLAVVGRGHGWTLGVQWPGGFPVGPLGGQGVLRGLWGGHFGGGGGVVEHVVEVVQVGHQVFPEGHFGGAVVVAHPRLQADVQVQLVLGVVLGPGHLLEAVRLGVEELGVLRNRLVGIPAGEANERVLN